MQLIRGLHNLRPQHRGCVATFGNFDGVHLGHQHVLAQLRAAADERQLPAVVITNEPLSREFFAPDASPPRLTRLREKLALFDALGVDCVLCQHFNNALAAMPAEEYVERVLVNGLGVRHLVTGDDSRFGRDRAGDFALLQRLGERHGFSVARSQSLLRDGHRVSSSRLRAALNSGDMALAATLLARPYHMSGRVAHGEKRGRHLGFPTANIDPRRRQTPLMGVFAVEIGGIDAGQRQRGVASIGVRPTFGGGACLLEVHIFDFNRQIYGCHVDVFFHLKLRDELHFDSADALIAQMHTDAAAAREFFSGSFATDRTNV